MMVVASGSIPLSKAGFRGCCKRMPRAAQTSLGGYAAACGMERHEHHHATHRPSGSYVAIQQAPMAVGNRRQRSSRKPITKAGPLFMEAMPKAYHPHSPPTCVWSAGHSDVHAQGSTAADAAVCWRRCASQKVATATHWMPLPMTKCSLEHACSTEAASMQHAAHCDLDRCHLVCTRCL